MRLNIFFVFFASVGILYANISIVPQKVTLQLQWLHQFQFAGYYIAKEKGFYRQEGLDVDIREYQSGINVADEVLEGRADFGVGRSSLIIDRVNGKPVVALGAIFQNSPHVLLVIEASGIRNAKELKNKRIMITEDALTSASILAMLSNQGLSRGNFTLQPHSMNLQDLIDGKTDAMAAYISNEPFTLEQMGIPYRMLSPQNYGFDFYSDIFFTSEALLERDPDKVDAFYKATIDGWRYAFEHIDETVSLILEKYNSQHKSKEALLYEANALKQLTYASDKLVPLGHIDSHKIKRIADIFMVLGQMDKDCSLDGFIYDYHKHKAGDIRLTKKEREWLATHHQIRVGIDIAWPPFEFIDEEGSYRGMAAEYLRIIEKKLGITFRIEKKLSWAEVVDKMKRKELDLYSCVVETPERKSYMNFTTPYLSFPMVIISNDNNPFIEGLDELKDKKVAVVEGYVTEELLRTRHPEIELTTFKNVENALQAVAFGHIYAYVGNIATASYYIKKLGMTNVKIAGETPYRFELGMAGRSDWPILTTIMQKALDSIDEKERDRIYKEWISVSYEHGTDYTLIWRILGVVTLLFMVIFAWNRTLARQVSMRKNAEAKLKELNENLNQEVTRQIEQMRRKDELLLRQSKMAALGEMIGVIAHQLKQPLNAIGLIAQDIKDAYEYQELDQEYIDSSSKKIMANIDHMATTVDDFRNFFNPNKKKSRFNTAQAIQKSVDLLRAQYDKYKIRIDIACTDAELFGMENEFQQIIINLVSNSKDAILERNTQDRHITISSTISGADLLLNVCDTAGGIDEELIEKIFDAYFSTKGEQGTGIGLYMVSMIVTEGFGGNITVNNKEKGACFEVRFPLPKE